MFYDRLTISIRAGRGGDGSASFRREAHVPRGGCDGGDGGNGGNVIFTVDESRRDLAHLRRKRSYAAEDGGNGARRKQHGKQGSDIEIQVPQGTQIFTLDERKLSDMTSPGESVTIAEGGAGGRGNVHFVTPVRRAPAYAEIGMPGDELEIELRLKLMADAALIGVPNAGKSSLLRRVSNAKPKVGAYPFTTLAPVLGTIERPDGSQIVMVDVPGLLEGASEGHGMGHEFLSHFERARMLVHTIALEDIDTVGERFRVIQNELWAYDPRIAQLPQIVALTKSDLVDEDEVERARTIVSEAIAKAEDHRGDVLAIVALSSATGQGLTEFLKTLLRASVEIAENDSTNGRVVPLDADALDDYRVYRPRPRRRRFRIYREKDGFRVTADNTIQALAERSTDSEDAAEQLHEWLEDQGAMRALRMAGAGDGSAVTVCGVPFEMW